VAGYLIHRLPNDEDTGWLEPVAAFLVLCPDETVRDTLNTPGIMHTVSSVVTIRVVQLSTAACRRHNLLDKVTCFPSDCDRRLSAGALRARGSG
jgi:hypothetical protein